MKTQFLILLLIPFLSSCNFNTKKNISEKKHNFQNEKIGVTEPKYTNKLIHETSPYLLQHAHNPVNWFPWGKEALNKAIEEDKPILISIGYSACHWCHVMEKECFENEDVAKIMNDNFICIKVDREERPDIDQVYMSAVQLMNQSGGWPLNCFTLPDGRPIFGGTYFPPERWKELLIGLNKVYKNDRNKAETYADKLTQGINQIELIHLKKDSSKIKRDPIDSMVNNWKKFFDKKHGGGVKAPKFPIPNNYEFLLQYGYLTQNTEILNFVHLTLKKMAYGGIYDQIGGGFARYSTDAIWKVPHFEKMLYDNAQLVSLYSLAYKNKPSELYKNVVYETISFVERELTSKEGAFYSSLDADSEGEEGKFYIWKKEELEKTLGDQYKLAKLYFNINSKGLWEKGNYILLRNDAPEKIAKEIGMEKEELKREINIIRQKLLNERNKKTRPGLDDKSLTSWNALMLKACLDAYKAFNEDHFLDLAKKNINFIEKRQIQPENRLNHSYKNGISSINGYLEDYAFLMEAYIALYENSFEENWLTKANNLMIYCIDHFFNKNSGMFFFTSEEDPPLIARKQEVHDNVIPASNSSIARSLFTLGTYLNIGNYKKMAVQMLKNIIHDLPSYGSGYSNWAILGMNLTYPFYEIAISGKDFRQKSRDLHKEFLPNTLILASEKESKLDLLKSKWVKGTTMIYVCKDNLCKLPVTTIPKALEQIVYYE